MSRSDFLGRLLSPPGTQDLLAGLPLPLRRSRPVRGATSFRHGAGLYPGRTSIPHSGLLGAVDNEGDWTEIPYPQPLWHPPSARCSIQSVLLGSSTFGLRWRQKKRICHSGCTVGLAALLLCPGARFCGLRAAQRGSVEDL